MEPHAQLEDGVNVAAQAVSGQAERGDRVARHAAEHRLFFVQVHLHALCGEEAGAGQPAGPAPMTAARFPVWAAGTPEAASAIFSATKRLTSRIMSGLS